MLRDLGTIVAVVAGLLLGFFLSSWLKGRGGFASLPAKRAGRWQSVLMVVSMGAIWGLLAWRLMGLLLPAENALGFILPYLNLEYTAGIMILCGSLVGIACIRGDARLSDLVTLPGMAIGIVFSVYISEHMVRLLVDDPHLVEDFAGRIVAIVAAGAIALGVRWTGGVLLHREILGWGEVHLMAMLAAWLGLSGAVLALFTGIVLRALIALTSVARQHASAVRIPWAPIPLGAYLSTGGIVSCLWGQQIFATHLRLAALSTTLGFPLFWIS
jgi:prepilin signal peptidase PulO-like enzyme (type II secretory pathway)